MSRYKIALRHRCCALYDVDGVAGHPYNTRDTRILHFRVRGKAKKRIAIVAREITEERDEGEIRGSLT